MTGCPGADNARECDNQACRRHGCQGGGGTPVAGITAAHVEKETLVVDVNIPEHGVRVTTAIFRKTRLELIEREGGRCYICNQTEEETGHPLEAHHFPIERAFGELVDWDLFKRQALAGEYGPGVQSFDWATFDPAHWENFVDDMRHNGLLLCKPHHVGRGQGIHMLPHPIWLVQRCAKEGYSFSSVEVIHHDDAFIGPSP